jgi:hypothetical protein
LISQIFAGREWIGAFMGHGFIHAWDTGMDTGYGIGIGHHLWDIDESGSG